MSESPYQKRVAAGLCGKCGKLPLPGKKLCKDHADDAKAKVAARRAAKKSSGICIEANCGETTHDGHTRCARHLQLLNESRKAKTAEWRAAGVCQSQGPDCGPIKPGTTMCQKCIDARNRISSERHRQKTADKEAAKQL